MGSNPPNCGKLAYEEPGSAEEIRMSQDIDFTRWTDAQLKAGLRFDVAGEMQSEIDRRRSSGTGSDGSEQRVADMIARPRRGRGRKGD